MSDCEWTVDDYLEKLYPNTQENLSISFTKVSRVEIQDKDVTDSMLQESYVIMAEIVKVYGEQYLPIFERLHEEIDSRQKKEKLLAAALKVSIPDPEPFL